MNWLYISIIAYLLLAIANLGDKLVVSKYLTSPKVYAITVAMLQALVILLLPFFGEWPGWQNLALDFAAGAIFVIAIYYLYTALKAGETSRVIPTIDGLVPIVVLILSAFVLSESLNAQQFLAIVLLIGGGFLLAYEKSLKDKSIMKYMAIAIIAFAVYQVLAKITFNTQPFLSAFIWARVGGLMAVIPFLFLGKVRQELKDNFSQKNAASNSKAVGITQAVGGAAFFLQSYAVKLGNVSIVLALQGVKYFFLFILIILFSKKFTQLKEDWSGRVLVRKLGGAGLIVGGLVLLVL